MSKAAAQGAQRPTRRAAQQHRYADMQVEGNGEYSSYDEPAEPVASQADQPASRVDLAKLKLPALRKYSRLYELPNVDQQTTHADLTFAVSRHWNTAPVTEDTVLQSLMRLRQRF